MSESNKKKVLIIIPNLGNGGAQKVFRQQLDYLADDFEVSGCVFNWNGSFSEDQRDNIVSLDVPGGKTTLEKTWYFILRIIKLRKLKQDKRIQVSISHLEGADYVNLLSKRTDKTICWIHGTKRHDANIEGLMGTVRLKLLMPILYRRSNQIVTVSNGIANELKEKMKGIESRTSVIHNGFDVNQLTLLSTEPVDEDTLRIFNSFKVLVTHCRLSRQKNLEGLLTVYSRIDYQNTKLVIIGDGELREKLIQLARQLGLSVWSTWDNVKVDATYNVYFMGQQANPFKYLRLASVYIMTSGWEGFPLALCEAMACGLPVITADCFTGPREIVANEIALAQQPITEPCSTQYGVLMPLLDISSSQNIEMWSHEVTRLLYQRVSNLSQNHPGIDRIRQFQLSETLKQTANLINTVLE